MPNHVMNKIRINAKVGLAELKELIGCTDERAIDFEKIIPPPDNMFKGDLSFEDIKRYAEEGIPNWYNWQLENWGTKWNAYDSYVEDEWDGDDNSTIELHFDTAWASPKPIFDALRAMDGIESVYGHYVEEFAESAGII